MKRLIGSLLVPLLGCSAASGVRFELTPLSVDFGLTLEAMCNVPDTIDGACKLVEAGTESVFFPSKLEGEPSATGCSFVLTAKTSCATSAVTIFVASFSGTLFAEDGQDLEVPAAAVMTTFDDDGDGFSNYREHLGGSDPKDPSSAPKPAADAGVGDVQ